MRNFHSVTRARDAIANLFRVTLDLTANQPPLPAVFPNQLAAVIRGDREGGRTMQNLRARFPPPRSRAIGR